MQEKIYEGISMNKEFFLICAHSQIESMRKDRIHEIPLNIMENFRIMNFFPPNSKAFIKSYFYMLGFDTEEEKINELVHKFILFMDMINTAKISPNFLSNSSSEDPNLEDLVKNLNYGDFKLFFKITIRKIMQILKKCEEILMLNKEKKLKPSEIIFKAVYLTFLGKVSYSFIHIIKNIFQSVFFNDRFVDINELGLLEENSQELTNLKENLNRYLEINGFITNDHIFNNVQKLGLSYQRKEINLIYGKPSSYKSSLIKMAAFWLSINMSIYFLL